MRIGFERMKAPSASSLNALRTMQANKRVSVIERTLRSAMWRSGVRGYRVQSKLPGRPDILFSRQRLAVLVHGCFWHSCPACQPQRPKAHGDFWAAKLTRNVARDEDVVRNLRALGWRVTIVWEHEIRQDIEGAIRRIDAERIAEAGPASPLPPKVARVAPSRQD